MAETLDMRQHLNSYSEKLVGSLSFAAMNKIPILADALVEAWKADRSVYLCGNGGSAGNAVHLANDFLLGAGKRAGRGLRAEALSANTAVITALANDTGYDCIYADQIKVKANPGDVLIVLSGSGNSPNVVRALEMGNAKKMKTFAILGFSGGRCKEVAHHPIHFAIDDMQIAEDLQLVVGHICMQWLDKQLPSAEVPTSSN
jgi:D-sedoheptulose 7-phosphate isomerase